MPMMRALSPLRAGRRPPLKPVAAAPARAADTGLRLKTWAWCGAFVGALLALALGAPARWLADAIGRATGQQIVLADARGTVWQGSARLVLTGGEGSAAAAALPGRVQWSLRPALAGLSLALQADCCTAQPLRWQIQPQIGGLRVALADGRSQWPARILAGLGTPWNTLQPEGALDLSTRDFSAEWNAGRLLLGGSALLEARDVSSRLSTLRPMGSYRLRLQGGPSAGLTLDTLEGALQLSGSGQWVGSRLRFNGEASAAPEREAALSNFLNIIGRRNGTRSVITLG